MLQKQPLSINFAQGLDLKSDPKQVSLGKFSSLQNSIFNKTGLLQKRNGFEPLVTVSDRFTYVTTFNEGLVAIGNSLSSYSGPTSQMIDRGMLQTATLSTIPLVRSSLNQTYADAVVAPNGLVLTAYVDPQNSVSTRNFIISDSNTGQTIVSATAIPTNSSTINTIPKVFLLGVYFVILYGTSSNSLQYTAIPYANPIITPITGVIALSYSPSSQVSWEGVVGPLGLYVAYNNTSGGQSIKLTYLQTSLAGLGPTTVLSGATFNASLVSLAVDLSAAPSPAIYLSWFNPNTTQVLGYVLDQNLNTYPGSTTGALLNTTTPINMTSTARDGTAKIYVEISDPYPGPIANNSVVYSVLNQNGTATGTATTLKLGVGLASKGFSVGLKDYLLVAFGSTTQPSYFVIDTTGAVIARFAYSNGGGYTTLGLPNVTVNGYQAQIPYLIKDFIASTNKATPIAPSTSAVYSQTGVNLLTLAGNPPIISSAEIGGTLNVSGAMLWSYDGVKPVEQGFNVFPDNISLTTGTGTGGSIAPGTYYYQVTYEWSDNNGNVNRSAPSIPVSVVVTSANSTNIIQIPTLRLTHKTNVRIVVYRWSVAQQTYYAISPPSATPTISSRTLNFMDVADNASDAQILGNPILYTTGGVVEDIQAPATNVITLFNNRLWLVDAEDTNLLWYSKQVIEATPVEMSDLLTLYVAPTTGAQGSTGPITALAPLDDKLIVFKKDALYYISGVGPDNTGANSQYSDAIFISAVVGSANQNSIVFTPSGLMFQSDKGIWLLGRDLSTNYIGAPVESLTLNNVVKTALLVPGTNQVRFTMQSGITLMYDYYFQQWGTFTSIPGIASTLYNSLHTYLNTAGIIFQETPGLYLDASRPVLMSFTTGWGNLAGLQGYERLYFLFLLGQYITPFKLNVSLSYDYNEALTQTIVVSPNNYTPTFGSDALFGTSTPFGGLSQVFEARLFPKLQKCESFQLSVQEVFDPTYGTIPGAGLTLSGMNLVVGAKKGYRVQSNAKSFG